MSLNIPIAMKFGLMEKFNKPFYLIAAKKRKTVWINNFHGISFNPLRAELSFGLIISAC